MNDMLRQQLESALSEERSDIEKYTKMINCAKEQDCHKIAKVLCDIKHDEESHAKYLCQLIKG